MPRKGQKNTIETRNKLSKSWKYDKHNTPEIRNKISNSMTKYLSEHPRTDALRLKSDIPYQIRTGARIIAQQKISLKNKKCEWLGCTKVIGLQRHHFDYYKPLEVKIYCKEHHKASTVLGKDLVDIMSYIFS